MTTFTNKKKFTLKWWMLVIAVIFAGFAIRSYFWDRYILTVTCILQSFWFLTQHRRDAKNMITKLSYSDDSLIIQREEDNKVSIPTKAIEAVNHSKRYVIILFRGNEELQNYKLAKKDYDQPTWSRIVALLKRKHQIQ